MEVHEIARKKVVEKFNEKNVTTGVLLLKGGEERCMYDTDAELLFR